jgi:hypothetical protein
MQREHKRVMNRKYTYHSVLKVLKQVPLAVNHLLKLPLCQLPLIFSQLMSNITSVVAGCVKLILVSLIHVFKVESFLMS